MFFYDSVLQLYISDTPLLVSERVLQASKKIGVPVTWNNDGFINRVSFLAAKELCKELGSIMLSIKDFMHLAGREPRVASPGFAEWLDDTFTLSPDGSHMIDSQGRHLTIPAARPAWFALESIGPDGFPLGVSVSPDIDLWKFWTLGHHEFTAAAVRSFVTSSGTCSLDLGIPEFAQHPNFMIRECYRDDPRGSPSPLDTLWPRYLATTLSRDDDEIERFLTSLDLTEIAPQHKGDGFAVARDRERLADIAGKKRLLANDFDGLRLINLADICNALSKPIVEDTTYVTGHANPDADSIVSSVFEAVRRDQIHPDRSCVAWTDRVPPVVEFILGREITACLRNTPKFLPYHDIVLVDCHTLEGGQQHQVKSVIDHHIIKTSFPYYVSISHEVSWSSTVQVYIKMLGSGLDVDAQTARILFEATKIEAEPALMRAMSKIDRLAIRRLEMLAQQSTSYDYLMRLLIDGSALNDVFMEDYKETVYGFAVIKSQTLASYEDRARRNNVERHLPLTVVKQVLYSDSQINGAVTEHISLHFNDDFYDKGFRAAIQTVTRAACEAFHGAANVAAHGLSITVTNVPSQTPRLLLLPTLETVVREHLKFFYSPAVGRYVSCGFFCRDAGVYGNAPSSPPQPRPPTTCVSYDDVKALLGGQSNTSMLSLRQYWLVYREREALGDAVSLRSLRDPNYVELLDTVIQKGGAVVHNDEDAVVVDIAVAKPALIRPGQIDTATGFPKQLTSPDTYGDDSLWRYWSPDGEGNVATRGHIFVMNQTCIDLKIERTDKTRQLTFRPVYRDIADLRFHIEHDGGRWIKVKVFPRQLSILG